MSDGATHQMPIGRASEVSRLHLDTADVLARIDVLAGRPTALQVAIQPLAERLELLGVVDDGDDDVAALVSRRVEGVAAHDEPPRGVVLIRNLTHTRSLTPQRVGPRRHSADRGGTVADEDLLPLQQDRHRRPPPTTAAAEGGRSPRRPGKNRRVVQESSDSVGTLWVWHPVLRTASQ